MRQGTGFAAAVVVSVTGFVTVVLGLPARAQTGYPPRPGASQSLSATVLAPGDTFTVSGTGYGANSPVRVVIRSQETGLGATVTDEVGAFSVDVTIPCDFEPGSHTVASTGSDSSGAPLERTSAVTVVDAPCRTVSSQPGAGAAAERSTSAPPAESGGRRGNLPRTGDSSSVWLLLAAGGLIALGGIVVVVSRRRDQADV